MKTMLCKIKIEPCTETKKRVYVICAEDSKIFEADADKVIPTIRKIFELMLKDNTELYQVEIKTEGMY